MIADTLARAQKAPAEPANLVVRAGLIALPFLCPFVAGPSVNVWQLLVAWTCLATLFLIGPKTIPAHGLSVWLTLGAAIVALSGASSVSTAWLPTCMAIAGMAAMACVGSSIAVSGPTAVLALPCGILIAGLLSAVLGLLQYYGLAEWLVPWTTSPALGQAYGNLRQRNQFATLISMALVAALWLYAVRASPRMRCGLMLAGVLLLAALAASTSRTGLLQLLLIVGVASVVARRERRCVFDAEISRPSLPPPHVLLAMIPLYFAMALVLPRLAGGGVEGMLQRLQTGASDDHSRLILWRNVLALISERPWTGWGWGELSFAHYSTLYLGPRFAEILDNAHNLPLHLAVELGVPAAVLICGGFVWMVIAAQPWRERDPTRLMAWGMLGASILHSLLEYPLWYGPFQLVFGLCLGILWPSRSTYAVPGWLNTRVRGPFIAAGLIAIVGYASWDYIRISQIYLPRAERLPMYEDDTLAKAKGSWLFARQVAFAELTLTTVTPANAARMHALAERTLHFSPEPRVIIKLIESAELSGREDEARTQAERFRIAFPAEFTRWLNDKPGNAPLP
ncbi:polymerase [Variovorax sp. KBW07]|uniref:PglL family O-oligosaccharyltransferase n=1 Tax=Variovorax sp. KBW07 TaxID=2153358 RepID=UPI000F560291|nr:Wzy polymerase domain-containing protein [Variovorax sp. KBW07]RQO62908.1 polymerase [Variovorax sp. KBW07]